MKWSFSRNDQARTILHEWWQSLEEQRGERARLRRCKRVDDVVFCPAYHRLLHRLLQAGYKVSRERLAAVAGLLSHVKEDRVGPADPKGEATRRTSGMANIADRMATAHQGEPPAVSEIRFRKLLETTDFRDIFVPMVRVLQLLNGAAELHSLADSILWWGDNVRKQWAYAYFARLDSQKHTRKNK